MQNLEQIIRPFQITDVLSKRRIISNSTKLDTEEVIVEWGRSGDAPAASEVEHDAETGGIGFEVVHCDDKYSEKDRKFKTVRIEQPDNPENYIMVDRINQITFDKKSEANNMTMYNNSTTSFVAMPMFDNNSYFADDPNGNKCNSSFELNNK
jgi:hypothetical protein